MQSSAFSRWVCASRFNSHVALPAGLGLLLTAMYFSGSSLLQNIVAPSMENVPLFTSREFGVLELLQNLILLGIVYYSVRCFMAADRLWIKGFALALVFIGVFTLLEEIDYGTPFVELVTGQYGSLALDDWDRNWHNKMGPGGTQNVDFLKIGANFGVLICLVLAPLFLAKARNPAIRLLVPSRWIVITVALVMSFSLLARSLEAAGRGFVGASPGSLYKNLSEFREFNFYYLLLLYIADLHERLVLPKTDREDKPAQD